ncbi:MAG: hypothetical protein ACW98Y_15110 [Candidatus Thorarchaeota archaeon]|jgi:hypothetical protein
MFWLKVIKDAIAFRLGHFKFSEAKINQSVLMPAIQDYADALIRTMKDYFSGDIRYTGEMAKGFGKHKLTQSSLAITQGAKHELFIRNGTVGPYKGFPTPVVAWAMRKLGKNLEEARTIAAYIQRNGTASSFSRYYPQGQRRFEYPESAVKDNKDKFDELAKKIGAASVKWISTGKSWGVEHHV